MIMSNRDLCIELINGFEEEQLKNVAVLLRSFKNPATETDDDFCLQLLNDYENDTDDEELMSIQDFSRELGIPLQ